MSGKLSLSDLLKVEEAQFLSHPRGFRRMDARVKLALTVLAVVLNVNVLSARFSLGLAALAWIGLALSRVPLRQMAWFVLAPLWATLGIVAGYTVGFGITPLFKLGPLVFHSEGLVQGLGVAARVMADMSWVALLYLTTPFTRILEALRWYRLPKVLVETLAFMYRYIFVLWEEFAAMRTAARARGGYQQTTQGLRTTGAIVAQIFLRAYDRSARIGLAMKARGEQAQA